MSESKLPVVILQDGVATSHQFDDAESPQQQSTMSRKTKRNKLMILAAMGVVAMFAASIVLFSIKPTVEANTDVTALTTIENAVAKGNVEQDQWSLFLKNHVKEWNGLWSRYNKDGTTRIYTKSVRRFTIPDPTNTDLIVQENIYDNQDFSQNGKWHYTNGNPPSWAVKQLDDGSQHPLPKGSLVLFAPFNGGGPANFGLPSNIQARYYFSELFLFHPVRKDIRISFTPIYVNKLLSHVSITRENADVAYGTEYWSQKLTELTTAPALPGDASTVWMGTKQYMRPNFDILDEENVKFPGFSANPNYDVHHFPDGLSLTLPRNVGAEEVEIRCTWVYDQNTVLQGTMLYNLQGDLEYFTYTVYTPSGETNPPVESPTKAPTDSLEPTASPTKAPSTGPDSPTTSPTPQPTKSPIPVDVKDCMCVGGSGPYEQCALDSGTGKNVCFINWGGSGRDPPPCPIPEGGGFYYSTGYRKWYVVGCDPGAFVKPL